VPDPDERTCWFTSTPCQDIGPQRSEYSADGVEAVLRFCAVGDQRVGVTVHLDSDAGTYDATSVPFATDCS